jgi:RND family efflux transporter MFP subunit
MKKFVIIAVVVIVALAGVAMYSGMFKEQPAEAAAQAGGAAGATGGQGGGGRRGGGQGGFGGGSAGPLTVEVATAKRQSLAQQITVVGNLIGEATVSVVPRAAGRLESVSVKMGDRVSRGQKIAQIENQDILEQVKQAEAAQQVSQATIRQREADLQLAQTNAERSRNLYERQLLPKQTLDDTESRYQSAIAQLDLARAQSNQTKARIDELRINLGNTAIVSPVNGFVSKRSIDPGAFASQNAPVVDVVDISRVRLTASIVEKDLKQLQVGDPTRVEVDAYPGEVFTGRIARVSPVLDPSTRTAPIEIEIPNGDFRLKPGMYARVGITTNTKRDSLVVPANAVIDLGGRRGVFFPQNNVAIFRAVQPGLEQGGVVEILTGVNEGDRVITTGASALRDGDRIVLNGAGGGRGAGRQGETAAGVRPEGATVRNRAAATRGFSENATGAEAGSGTTGADSAGRRFGGQRPAGQPQR